MFDRATRVRMPFRSGPSEAQREFDNLLRHETFSGGTDITRALLDAALEAAPGAWFLEVRESNVGAIRLYENAGFRVCGTRPAYYSEPCESGIVMSREK